MRQQINESVLYCSFLLCPFTVISKTDSEPSGADSTEKVNPDSSVIAVPISADGTLDACVNSSRSAPVIEIQVGAVVRAVLFFIQDEARNVIQFSDIYAVCVIMLPQLFGQIGERHPGGIILIQTICSVLIDP